MPTTEWLESEIKSILPNSEVEAIDLHGTKDHFHIRIIDESFSEMRPLQRQKLILNHFREHIPSPIHAIDLKCMTPEQAQNSGEPFPLPIRTSVGFFDTGIFGNILVHTFPVLFIYLVKATLAASICFPITLSGDIAFKAYAP